MIFLNYATQSCIFSVASTNLRFMADPEMSPIWSRHLKSDQTICKVIDRKQHSVIMISECSTTLGTVPFKNKFPLFVLLALLICSFLNKPNQSTFFTLVEIRPQRAIKLCHQFLTYFQPTIDPQRTQYMSATVCIPVVIILSSFSPNDTFTLQIR